MTLKALFSRYFQCQSRACVPDQPILTTSCTRLRIFVSSMRVHLEDQRRSLYDLRRDGALHQMQVH
jgi:hypothetical protein